MVTRLKVSRKDFDNQIEYRRAYRRSYQGEHEKQKLEYNAKSRKYAYNNCGRWTKADKAKVMAHKLPDPVLAKRLGRTIQAIQAVRNRELAKGGIYV